MERAGRTPEYSPCIFWNSSLQCFSAFVGTRYMTRRLSVRAPAFPDHLFVESERTKAYVNSALVFSASAAFVHCHSHHLHERLNQQGYRRRTSPVAPRCSRDAWTSVRHDAAKHCRPKLLPPDCRRRAAAIAMPASSCAASGWPSPHGTIAITNQRREEQVRRGRGWARTRRVARTISWQSTRSTSTL